MPQTIVHLVVDRALVKASYTKGGVEVENYGLNIAQHLIPLIDLGAELFR
jgi:hypothetical protein